MLNFFTAKTDEENFLVCLTKDVPPNATERDDGWRTFRIQGTLDFSLIGILSEISGILADNKIGIFAVSTYNTDKGLSNKCFVMSVCVKCSMLIPLDSSNSVEKLCDSWVQTRGYEACVFCMPIPLRVC